jgi:hypothetical protein
MQSGIRVFVDGVLQHNFENAHSLRKGADLALADGSRLSVRMMALASLDVRRDGVPLPGSDSDRRHSLSVAASLMFWIGGIMLAFELETIVRKVNRDLDFTFAGVQALGDVVFLCLGVLTKRGARWALGVAVTMALVSTVVSWVDHRGVVSTIWQGFVFALLAQRFAATSPAPPR